MNKVRSDPDQDFNPTPTVGTYFKSLETGITSNGPAIQGSTSKPVETPRKQYSDADIRAFEKKDMLMVKMNCENNSTALAVALAAWITAKGEISNPDAFVAAIEEHRIKWFNQIYLEVIDENRRRSK